MSIDQFITFTARVNSAGIAREGFGTALILSHNAAFPERTKVYNQYADAVPGDFAAGSPEGLALAALFSQAPHPRRVKVGRAAGLVTLKYAVRVLAIRNSTAYKILADGPGITTTTTSFTSDSTATNDEIVDGIVLALNAVVGKNYTAASVGTPGTKTIEVTGNAAGNWFSLQVKDATALALKITHSDPVIGVAADLAAILTADTDWYTLLTLYNSHDYVLAAAAWVEANGKDYIVDVPDTDAISTALANGDTLDDLVTHGYTATLGQYSSKQSNMLSAALAGRLLPLNVGKWTAFGKTLVGPVPDALTPANRQHLVDRRAGAYTNEGGVPITWDGKVGSTVYLFLDIKVSVDWLSNAVKTAAFNWIISADKRAYTDEDIATLAAVIRGVIREATSDAHDVLDPGDVNDPNNLPPGVTFPRVSDIDPSVRALRRIPDATIIGRFQGAAQGADFIGTFTF